MERTRLKFKDKKGAGIATTLIAGVGALVITVIVTYLIVDTLLAASLLTAGGTSNRSATDLALNLTDGVDEVAAKIPTILLIAAVVILFGAIVLLVQRSRQMSGGGGGI